ncbi:AMP-dependent synthetase/ligase [Anaeromyxobacter paludicola]|uniref:AMP-dependent synthetase n=1 Tax=Anaeromyxobacter paludicola TaxID=2918171 RepID=A0ABM7X9B1_9BACT|nr:long-chain fatty acid--CoA ligase [Anaeromyxobacter paludicola]BDG08436.1 AMP-dependent synthetase [Anaeromyxobacter paludicola]
MTRTARSLCQLFLDRIVATPAAEAFRVPHGEGWRALSWGEVGERVAEVSQGLLGLGLHPEERCAVFSGTRLEWLLADWGVLCAGGATTTIYPSSTPEETEFILRDAGVRFAFAENQELAERILSRRDGLPALEKVFLFEGHGSADGFVTPLAALCEAGRARRAADPGEFERAARAVRHEQLATLIYTSGTTGRPKGVELTHAAWAYEAEAVLEVAESARLDGELLQYFWLPLAHAFGKAIGGVQLVLGFPTALDGRVDRVVENLGAVRPTFMCAVPRVFEKVHNRILARAREGGRARLAVLRWAVGVGRAASRLRRAGREVGPLLRAELALADRLALRKIRAAFGGRLQFFVSGSAPLAVEIAEFFDACGITILEGWGLTEAAAIVTVNVPWKVKLGTVGAALPGTELRIAEDGEVLVRGPGLMRGYHGLPEATAEALRDGWLHTGDVGTLDADGYLTITDRKKDLIKTSGGKYVAPQELETRLKALSPFVSQVLVHGDRRKYVTALLTAEPVALRAWAERHGLAGAGVEELVRRPEVLALFQAGVDRLNATLPRYATVKRFAVLAHDFSEAEGEVTATQKLRRKVIEERHRALLDGLYGEE